MTLLPSIRPYVRYAGRSMAKPLAKSLPLQTVAVANLPTPVAPEATREEQALIESSLSRAGLDIGDYRIAPLRRRVKSAERALRRSKIAGSNDFARELDDDGRLANLALDALLIGFTMPFRDAKVFRSLAARLPGLAQGDGGLRVWSIACSSGAELLSLALLLANSRMLEKSVLRGSDTRRRAIAEAGTSSGTFWEKVPAEFAHLRDAVHRGEFERQARSIEWVVEDILNTVPPPAAWDLVACRNLAIYLEPRASGALWEKIARTLRPGGILLTGKAEKPTPRSAWMKLDQCIYQRTAS